MKIIVVGATGTIGKAITQELGQRHDIIGVAHSQGDVQVDITSLDSIKAMYQSIGAFDALVSATGAVHFGSLMDITAQEWQLGLNSKLMGQVNLVLEGIKHINENGSFTLTSGILSDEPIRYGTSASMVNRAIEGFVLGAAVELPKGIRINVVSPTVIEESLPSYGPYFRGFDAVSAAKAALGYAKSVEGLRTGTTIRVNGLVD